MDFIHSDKVKALQERLAAFMEAEIYPTRRVTNGKWRPVTAGSRPR
jgi:hypothetical protein